MENAWGIGLNFKCERDPLPLKSNLVILDCLIYVIMEGTLICNVGTLPFGVFYSKKGIVDGNFS